jgi:hypothetical protein
MKQTFTAEVHLAAMEVFFENHYRNPDIFREKICRTFSTPDSK